MPLETTIPKLVTDADAVAPEAVEIELGGGLWVNLRREGDEYVLSLWSYRRSPPVMYWNQVCAHMPYLVPVINPERGKDGDKFTLHGRIPAYSKAPRSQLEFWAKSRNDARR